MKIAQTGIFLSLLVTLLFGSCASPPASLADSRTAVPAASEALISEEPVTGSPSEPALVPDLTAETILPVDLVVEDPTELSIPEQVEAVPPLPPGDRILYFYPEPEDLYVPPVETVPSPAKTVVPKPAVVPKVAAASAAVASAAVAPAAATAPKVAPAPVEKPVEVVLPGIWVGESVPIAAVEKIPPVPPSRKVSLAAGQTLEVWYPGSGWVYLGDSSAQNGLAYETRKLDKTDTLFTFKALKSGNYILDFSRFDLLADSFSSDSLAVEVSDAASKRTEKIRAPNYRSATTMSSSTSSAPVLPDAALNNFSVTMTDEPGLAAVRPVTAGSTSASSGNTATSSLPAARTASTPIDAETVLAQAKKALAANDPSSALEQLDRFFTAAVSTLDEGWFMRGQAYEANGAGRDIRKALAAYETLVSAYPESARWKEADARIRYIKQFYLQIR